ncbi:MAG: FtsX-like permease family protein [Balneolales bacterium]|nr:FtsX-like permease family protein [Balneolales bacterium]
MKLTHLLASRYLFSKKKVSLVSLLTLISIAGVTIGTALLIIVLSVFNGFFELVKDMMRAQDPDIRIESVTGRSVILTEEQISEITDMPLVSLVTPYVQGRSLIAMPSGGFSVATIKGIEPEPFKELFNLETYFGRGEFDLSMRDRRPGMLMSRSMSGQLGLDLGSEAALLSAESIQRSVTQFSGPRTLVFDVRGTYRLTESQQEPFVYVDIRAAQRLFNLRNSVSGYELLLTDHQRAEEVKQDLQLMLGDGFLIQTWYDIQKPLYDVMNLEKWGAYIILMIIVLVAVLNIVGSLTMIVIQKTRDIALLRSIGFTQKNIRSVFLRQGFIIGAIGCGLGGGIGLLLSWLQQKYGLVKLMGAESFIINAYPVQLLASDIILVLTGSLLLCVLASLYPASRAAKVTITDALRYE